jgi:hypothetical protein
LQRSREKGRITEWKIREKGNGTVQRDKKGWEGRKKKWESDKEEWKSYTSLFTNFMEQSPS